MKMPRSIVHFPLPLCLFFLLAACAPIEFESYPDETVPAGGTPVINADSSATGETGTLPLETRLILGTLRLEGTDQAVGANQASILLPLWQRWHDQNRSNTATAGDRDALLAEIQAAMTPDQMQAIDAMQLTQADVSKYIQENNIGFPSRPSETPPAGGADGTPPPQNNGSPFGGDQTQTLSPDEIATLQSVYKSGFGGTHGPDWVLLHALLDLLESKTPA